MKIIKTLASGVLLTLGFMFLLLAIVKGMEKDPGKQNSDALLGGLLLGIPTTVSGGLLAWNLYQAPRKHSEVQLRETFFRLIKADNGRVTPMGLSMATGISGEAAKLYLDEQAREFVADFGVDDQGNVYYQFSLGSVGLLEP